MEADRRDHLALVRERSHERAREIMPLVRLVAGASPVMQGLTQDDNWNRYLGYLQGIVDTWTKAHFAVLSKLGNPALTDAELRKLNCDALVADTWIAALKLAMELPKAIMSGHEEAERLIKEFDRAQEKKNDAKAT